MKDVLHVRAMTSNLVAVSALEDEGYDLIFSSGRVYIQGMIAMTGLRLIFVMEAYTD